MRKLFTVILGLLCFYSTVAQLSLNRQMITSELPEVIPPAPSVAAFMKFEEIPVNNYTGIPNISIPIYTLNTYSKDIAIDLSLNYHPLSIAAEEGASYVGLGWNLNGGGVISRTVRGIPDESRNNGMTRSGVYHYENNSMADYDEVFGIFGTSNMTAIQIQNFNILLYDAAYHGKFDTEHDLYQYNFLNHSGRFYVKKNLSNALEVVKLGNNDALKISVNYNDTSYKITSFTIRDDFGNNYIFNVPEITTTNFVNEETSFNGPRLGPVLRPGYDYISAFHLSEIIDKNTNTLVTYDYNGPNDPVMLEKSKKIVRIDNFSPDAVTKLQDLMSAGATQDELSKFDPKVSLSATQTSTQSKKMKQIVVDGIGKIDFIYTGDRADSNNSGTHRLRELIIKNFSNTIIKKIKLDHNYSDVDNNGVGRMLLKKVTFGSESDTLNSYKLFYKLNPLHIPLGKDYWGFFNTPDECAFPGKNREASPYVCTMDVLQKMTLPTGGATIYNYESNTYSYVGDEPLTDFDGNPDNWICHDEQISLTYGSIYEIPISSVDRQVLFSADTGGYSGSFDIFEYGVSGRYHNVSCGQSGTNCNTSSTTLEANKGYYIRYFVTTLPAPAGTLYMKVKMKNPYQKKFLYGGGIRIKKIAYFEDDAVKSTYYEFPEILPAPSKVKTYDYSIFTDTVFKPSFPVGSTNSSGSLVFQKPEFKYNDNKSHHIRTYSAIGLTFIDIVIPVQYEKTTTTNILMAIRTHGGDVGYKNVTVSETGNGKSRFVYTSPIDWPEDYEQQISKKVPVKNLDYKRGLLQHEMHFKEGAVIPLSETFLNYNIVEGEETSGYAIASTNCPYPYGFLNGTDYYTRYLTCAHNNTQSGCEYFGCGTPASFVMYAPIIEAFGWSQLKSKTVREHLEGGTIETTEKYTYNATNKQLASHTVERYNSGGIVDNTIVTYQYKTGFPNNNISSIEKIQTVKNGQTIDAKQLIYTGQNPTTVQTSHNGSNFEDRLYYNNYDLWGRPRGIQRVGSGQVVNYIYGYNSAYPVAVIENAFVGQVGLLIGAVQEASADSISGKLDDLRNELNANQPQARLTTYLYDSFGVKEITDPNGFKTYYEYDDFGRLIWVKDNDGKLLSENQYNYRP